MTILLTALIVYAYVALVIYVLDGPLMTVAIKNPSEKYSSWIVKYHLFLNIVVPILAAVNAPADMSRGQWAVCFIGAMLMVTGHWFSYSTGGAYVRGVAKETDPKKGGKQ